MLEVTDIEPRKTIVVGSKQVLPWRTYCKNEQPEPIPQNYETQKTTVWSFPERGSWASHTPQYRGNWSPHVVRNLLELYSKPGDLVLDPMVGGGTTPVECMITGRKSISVDINPDSISVTKDRLCLPQELIGQLPSTEHRLFIGDARKLDLIPDRSIDLILTHPPYANMIRYTKNNPNDLSLIDSYSDFFSEYSKAISEFHRVLKPGRYCAVMIGDTHSKGHYVPISARMMMDFLNIGFVLKEDIIKKEWNCMSMKQSKSYSNILLTMHEHIFVFEKCEADDSRFPNSRIGFFSM